MGLFQQQQKKKNCYFPYGLRKWRNKTTVTKTKFYHEFLVFHVCVSPLLVNLSPKWNSDEFICVENWWYEHTVFQKWREKPVQLNMVPEYEVLSFLPAELRGLFFPSFKLSDFQDPPPPLSIYIQNSSTHWPCTFNFKRTPHPSLSKW